MNQPQSELNKLLQHIDSLIAQAPDEATRKDLERMRARLDSPEMLDMARDLAGARPARAEDLVLEFHDPLLPMVLTATGCVIATAVCLFSIVYGFDSATAWVAGTPVNLWLAAVVSGAVSVMFTALSFMRTFSVRVDTEGMISRISGNRWRRLHVGGMPWRDIRSLHERVKDRVLEVRAAGGRVFEIPMRVVNFPILRQHLENMVRLYGDRPGAATA
ncbi:MAG TPA: hypothetical protein VFL16_08275 [Steroidobacteraceae bacterium]|nr:hypothetical protein [Steroidobacteraceae bacterium]